MPPPNRLLDGAAKASQHLAIEHAHRHRQFVGVGLLRLQSRQILRGLLLAFDGLDKDREFLKAGGVFSDDMIDAYIELKMQEVTKFRAATHPLEFQLYYSI